MVSGKLDFFQFAVTLTWLGKSIIILLMLLFTIQLYAQKTQRPGFIFHVGTEYSFYREYKKAYKDVNIEGKRIFGFQLTPKVFFWGSSNLKLGMLFQYAQYKDNLKDTLLFPVRRGIGVVGRYDIPIYKKKDIRLHFEPQFFLDNFAPLSKSNNAAKYSSGFVFPEFKLATLLTIRVWKPFYFGIGFQRSYFFTTRKLYFFTPGSFITLEYRIKNH
ncbi:MAG: hypothetical protein ACOYPR_11390 [Saprospiraceae bacterium]